MKTIANLYFFLFSIFVMAQNPTLFPGGGRFPNASEETINDSTKIAVMSGGNILNYYVPKSEIITDAQREWIESQMYENHTKTFTVSPTQGERGVSVPITVNYSITSNHDIFTSASINQGIGDIMSDIDDGFKSVSGGSKTGNTTYTMSLGYTRQGNPETESVNATYTSRIPQWAGWSSQEDFTNSYSSINTEADFQKYIQANSAITKEFSPDGEYIWFIITNGTGNIYDGNNFLQSVGTWGDGVSEFYRKSLTLTLADGTTTATVYLIRSRTTKKLTNFTYRSN